MNKETILITGGAGFIGSHLCEKLLSTKNIIVVDNFSTGRRSNIEKFIKLKNFTLEEIDVLDYDELEKCILKSDFVYHLAASVGVKYIMENRISSITNNIDGTRNVLDICSKYNKGVFIASTSEVYGKSENILHEDGDSLYGSTKKHRWSYAYSKAIDEFLSLAFYDERGLEVYIGRFFNTVGPRQVSDYGMVIPSFIEKAIKNEDICVYGDGSQSRCFCHVKDTCEALFNIRNKNCLGEIINIGNDKEITILELAKKVIKISKSESKIVFKDYLTAYGKGFEDTKKRVPNIQKAKKFINFYPTKDLDDIILNIIEYSGREK